MSFSKSRNMPRAAELTEVIQFRRYGLSDDGFSKVKTWTDLGDPVFARKIDVSDAERMRADSVSALLTARFTVRSSQFSRAITAKDAIQYRGVDYEIFGIKEIGRHFMLEITAGAEVSNGDG